ncbi:MAG: hypothetical protein DI570_04775 [Phenylobacterium zucineum]|nr:MAG: hypothetical protein DI570_04775 [Phenylobacterium zucineum]
MTAKAASWWGLVTALASVALPGAGQAQVGAFGGYYSSGTDQFNYVLNRIQMQTITRNAERRAGQRPAAPAATPASTVVGRSVQPVAPARLAAHYPAQHRAEAARTFHRVLDGYYQVETRLGIPKGDMAGAMAALIAGSWSACRDREIVDGHFVKVADQLRGAIGRDPRFAQVAAADRQMAYEQYAILGTELALVRMALQKQPDPAMRRRACDAGRSYLSQFGLDPEQLDITAQGLAQAG